MTPSTLDAWMRDAKASPALAFASVGHTSVVLKTRLANGMRVALRPRTASSPRGYVAELSAYRVAVALGMDHVPPVTIRRLSRTELVQKLDLSDEARAGVVDAIAWDRDGTVPCAAIAWVEGLRDADLERTGTWMPWLDGRSAPPPDREALADDLARTIAFDFLIGNIDRFSGGNLKVDRTGTRLVTRDHNLAFIAPLPARHFEALRTRLDQTKRRPREFTARLSAESEASLREVFASGDEGPSDSLLNERETTEFFVRFGALRQWCGEACIRER